MECYWVVFPKERLEKDIQGCDTHTDKKISINFYPDT